MVIYYLLPQKLCGLYIRQITMLIIKIKKVKKTVDKDKQKW